MLFRSGRVQIHGKVADAAPACGDGIAWEVVHQGELGRNLLGHGAFENGGQEVIGKTPFTVEVRPGDRIQLTVLPKMGHGCDTTTVEFEITAQDGKTWNVTKDTLAHFAKDTQKNPMPDSYGNPGVWQFSDMAGGAETIPKIGRAHV